MIGRYLTESRWEVGRRKYFVGNLVEVRLKDFIFPLLQVLLIKDSLNYVDHTKTLGKPRESH